MLDWIESIALGVVQGLTEFLPISSDGHLSITRKLFDRLSGRVTSGAEDLFFIVVVHLGTLAAILIRYRAVGVTGAKGLLGSGEVPPEYRRDPLIRTGLMVILATLPAVVIGLTFKHAIESTFASTTAAGVGFLITAAVLLITVQMKGGEKGPSEMTWRDALLIGIAQAFAPLPGVSRSGLTIASALGVGLSRSWAVGFSLLMAIPVILGGAVLELKDVGQVAEGAVAATGAGKDPGPTARIVASPEFPTVERLAGMELVIKSGPLKKARRTISGYDASTQLITLSEALPETPAAGTTFKIMDPSTFEPGRLARYLVATIVAGVVGYGAIIWLVRVVRSGRLWYFSVYLIVLGLVVLAVAWLGGGRPDAGHAEHLDRAVRLAGSRQGAGGAGRPLGRADTRSPGPGDAGAGLAIAGRSEAESLGR